MYLYCNIFLHMAQKILILTLPMLLLLTGCLGSSNDDKSLANTDSLSWTTTMTGTTTTPSLEDCKLSVDNYLKETKSMTLDTSKKVAKNNAIVVDYVGRLADGTVFDTSVESVAKACGLYTTQRNYSEWLAFTAWAWQMIPWFDAGVIGMSINETKTITIPSKEAYGAETVSFPVDQLPTKPDGSSYKAWESINTMNGAVKIESLDEKEFTIKNNHPLAGKDLIFDITIKTIK